MRKDPQKDRPPPLRIHRPPLPHQQNLQHYRQQRGQEQQPQPQPQADRQSFHTSTGGPPPQFRQPVIIHTYSPEVIQTDSRNFMQLVQRLTGPGSPHVQQAQPPPAKRARLGISSSSSGSDRLPPFAGGGRGPSIRERNRPPPLPLPRPSPLGVFPRQPSPASHLAHHPLLSPSIFDFSPSVLPSPSALTFDFSPLLSPAAPSLAGAPMQLQQYAPSTPTLGLSGFLPSPGPLSTTSFFADLPSLSPAAYSWIDRNSSSAEAILADLSSRPPPPAGHHPALPPRPPSSFAPSPSATSPPPDEKPFLYRYRQ